MLTKCKKWSHFSILLALTLLFLATDLMTVVDLLARGDDDGGSGGSSTGVCLAWPFGCGTFRCTGWYHKAQNGICFILKGKCCSLLPKDCYIAHECSTYLW